MGIYTPIPAPRSHTPRPRDPEQLLPPVVAATFLLCSTYVLASGYPSQKNARTIVPDKYKDVPYLLPTMSRPYPDYFYALYKGQVSYLSPA
jgi:hypothetical protein